eukprot:SAG31_NODE_27641_length_422_cov_1.544892_1_plen_122_part_10
MSKPLAAFSCHGSASADAAMLFFSFESQPSYWNVLRWQNEVETACGSRLPTVVVGTGLDLFGGSGGQKKATHIAVPNTTPAYKVSTVDGVHGVAHAEHLLVLGLGLGLGLVQLTSRAPANTG